MSKIGAEIITTKDLKLRYPLPKSMIKAAGLLRAKKIKPLGYQKAIRKEWHRSYYKAGN